jgi:serine/threonine-protein kinase RsbW
MKILEVTLYKGFYPLKEIRSFVGNICLDLDIGEENTYQIKTALDEVCSNIIRHAYKKKPGTIKIRLDKDKKKTSILIKDSGAPFNPLKTKRKTPAEIIKGKQEGGLGISLVERLMDEVHYKRKKRYNVFLMVKYNE